MALTLRNERTLRREVGAASMIPLLAHVDEHVAKTRAGDYVQTLRLSGASFESAEGSSHCVPVHGFPCPRETCRCPACCNGG